MQLTNEEKKLVFEYARRATNLAANIRKIGGSSVAANARTRMKEIEEKLNMSGEEIIRQAKSILV